MIAVTSHTPGRPATVTVDDRGSHTGTLVNGAPAHGPTVLAPGARIVVGRTTLGWTPAGAPPARTHRQASVRPGLTTEPPVRPVAGTALLDEPTVAAELVTRHPRVPAPAPAPAPTHAPAPAPAPATVRLAVPAPAAPVPAPVPTTASTAAPKPKRWLRSAAPDRPAHKSTLLATLTILLALATLAFAGAITNLPLLFPPLAASMALIAAGTALPLAQPRNVLGGHVVSAIVGFAAVALLGAGGWAAALAGACALAAMLLLRTSHSPAVGTAVIVGATAPSVLQFMELLVLGHHPARVRRHRRPAGRQEIPRLLVVTGSVNGPLTRITLADVTQDSNIGRRRAAAVEGRGEQYHDRRSEIVKAAVALFRERGYRRTSLADIAEAIGT